MPEDNHPTEFLMRPGSRKRGGAIALVCIAGLAWIGDAFATLQLSGSDERRLITVGLLIGTLAVVSLVRVFGAPLRVCLDETGFTYAGGFGTVRVRWEEVLSAGFPIRQHQPLIYAYDVRFRRGFLDLSGRMRITVGWLTPGPREFDAAFTHFWKRAEQRQAEALRARKSLTATG